jgi:hypothetical protein
MSYDAEQRKTIAALVAQGRKQGAKRKEVLSAFETALTEAALRNPNHGDGSSIGWRQETASSYPNANRLDLNASAARFYQELRGVRGKGLTASQAAQAVQRSAFPERYKQHQQEAVDLVHQYFDKGGVAKPKAAPKARTVTTSPGVDNSGTRKQLLLSYVSQRHDPNALLSLASGLKDAQDVPATTKVVKAKAPKAASAVPDTSGFKPVKAGETYSGTDGRQWKITPQAAPYLVRFDGEVTTKPIAALLTQARKMGWKGRLTLGYRSYDHQYDIYYRQGIRPAAVPGSSKHEQFKGSTAGAIDVSDAQGLANVLGRVKGNFLTWAGAKDPVHFSHPENGRY